VAEINLPLLLYDKNDLENFSNFSANQATNIQPNTHGTEITQNKANRK
jgi:hypothetical protein